MRNGFLVASLSVDQSELERLFEEVEDESGLSLAKFRLHCRQRFLLEDKDEQIRLAFKAFDSSGAGYISRKGCLDTFRENASFVPERVVELIFDEIDIDRDGKVTYRDFVKAWNAAETASKMPMTGAYARSL